METSHHGALPIHRFCPLRIQVSPSRLAVVVIPPLVPEPTSGSVSPKQPIFPSAPLRQPFLLLLLGSIEIDRAHRETAVYAPERAERRVDTRDLHRDEAEQLLAAAGAAIALKAEPADTEFLERRQQFERKRVIGPVLVDDRLDLGLHVGPHFLDDRFLLGGEKLDQLIEVAVGYGRRLRRGGLACCGCGGHLELLGFGLEAGKVEGRID